MGFLKRLYFLRAVFIGSMLLPALAFAQNQAEVVLGEYVIESAVAALGANSSTISNSLSRKGYRLQRFAGSKNLVVTRNSTPLAASADGMVIGKHDSSDSFCQEVIAAGVARSCSPNYVIRASVTPNDKHFQTLWGLGSSAGIDATRAWERSTGSSDVVVAVIDTGVQYNHPDLSQNVWINEAEIPSNGIDDDQNGYIDDVHGVYAQRNGDPFDDNGHGTHVAGVVGAVGNNEIGVSGVNWNVKIMALKFLDGNGMGSLDGAIAAIDYMVMMKGRGVDVRISNNSWGGGLFSQPLYNAIQRAEAAGILFVAASGNSGIDSDSNPQYPGSYDLSNVISVGAIDSDANLASFSNYGADSVDIAAPGVSILSTYPGGYTSLSGTSMASPHVAGALSLLLASEPSLTNAELQERLYLSARNLSTLTGLIRTGRTVDVARMVWNETAPVPEAPNEELICSYTVAETTYAPDEIVETTPVVHQGDEFRFYSHSLPFAFPFHGKLHTKVSVSPNGVVYLGSISPKFDYLNGPEAPLNSIAVLHHDFLSEQDGEGVRVYSTPERAVIHLKMRHNARKQSGPADVWLHLYPSGVIEQFVSIQDSELRSFIDKRATVGLSGPVEGRSTTYAYKNGNISRGVSIRYEPQCSAQPIASAKLSAWGVEKNGRRSAQALRGRPVLLEIAEATAGVSFLNVSFNRKNCGLTIPIDTSKGKAVVRGRLPRLSESYKELRLRVVKSEKRLRIRKSKKRSARSVNNRQRTRTRITPRRLSKQCGRFINSLEIVQ